MIVAKAPTSSCVSQIKDICRILDFADASDHRITLWLEAPRTSEITRIAPLRDEFGWSTMWRGQMSREMAEAKLDDSALDAKWENTSGTTLEVWRSTDTPMFDFNGESNSLYSARIASDSKNVVDRDLIAAINATACRNVKYQLSELYDRGKIEVSHNWSAVPRSDIENVVRLALNDERLGKFSLIAKTVHGAANQILHPPPVFSDYGTFTDTADFGLFALRASVLNQTLASAQEVLMTLLRDHIRFTRIVISRNFLRWPGSNGSRSRGTALNVTSLEIDYSTAALTVNFEQVANTGPGRKEMEKAFSEYWNSGKLRRLLWHR